MATKRDRRSEGDSKDDVTAGHDSKDDVTAGQDSKDDVTAGQDSKDDVTEGDSRDDVTKGDSRDDVTEGDSRDDVTAGQDGLSEERRAFLMDYFSKALGISTAPKPVSLLDDVSFEGIARYIASDRCNKVVTMAGAGISTSAGIPDFRSPGTGLYDNLAKYNLPDPTAAFNIDYFKENPEPFYLIRKDMFGKTYKPTPSHYFIELLERKNKLLRNFTQNVDGLERRTGLSEDKLIEAHGSFSTGHCQQCKHTYDHDYMADRVFDPDAQSPVPRCSQPECNGVIRPDIVMFGEQLPQRFADHVQDIDKCDCLIIMGTSLVVQPFASLTIRTKDNVPRLYMNMEKTVSGRVHPLTALMFGGGFDFDNEDNIRDVFRQGASDEGCYALADIIGWGDELREMVKHGHDQLDKQFDKTNRATSNIVSTSKTVNGATPRKVNGATPRKVNEASSSTNSSSNVHSRRGKCGKPVHPAPTNTTSKPSNDTTVRSSSSRKSIQTPLKH